MDLAAPPGTPVRAAAPGRVAFAGTVAGRGVLSVELTGSGDPPLRITYEPVRPLAETGTAVAAGDVVATLTDSGTHCAGGCLHWGLLRGQDYLDPLSLLPDWMKRRGPSRLLPVGGVPFGSGARAGVAAPARRTGAGTRAGPALWHGRVGPDGGRGRAVKVCGVGRDSGGEPSAGARLLREGAEGRGGFSARGCGGRRRGGPW